MSNAWAYAETQELADFLWRREHPLGCRCIGCVRADMLLDQCDVDHEQERNKRKHARWMRRRAAAHWSFSESSADESSIDDERALPAAPAAPAVVLPQPASARRDPTQQQQQERQSLNDLQEMLGLEGDDHLPPRSRSRPRRRAPVPAVSTAAQPPPAPADTLRSSAQLSHPMPAVKPAAHPLPATAAPPFLCKGEEMQGGRTLCEGYRGPASDVNTDVLHSREAQPSPVARSSPAARSALAYGRGASEGRVASDTNFYEAHVAKEARKAQKMLNGYEEAQMELEQSCEKFREISIMGSTVDISTATLVARVEDLSTTAKQNQQQVYVGSTTSPQWRWKGGWYYASSVGPHDDTPPNEQEFMPGHMLKWRSMVVLGAWLDAITPKMETTAIAACKKIAREWCANIADDARGLPYRSPFAFSFVYICVGTR